MSCRLVPSTFVVQKIVFKHVKDPIVSVFYLFNVSKPAAGPLMKLTLEEALSRKMDSGTNRIKTFRAQIYLFFCKLDRFFIVQRLLRFSKTVQLTKTCELIKSILIELAP